MFALTILAQGGTLDGIIEAFPTDPAALFTLGLCLVAIIAVFVGGRNKGQGSGPTA